MSSASMQAVQVLSTSVVIHTSADSTSPQPSPRERGCDLTQVLGVFNSMITGKEA